MKKVITLFSISLVALIFLACNNKKEKEQNKRDREQGVIGVPYFTKLVNNEKERTRLWKAAIGSGDFRAYNKISVAYIMSDLNVELYYYSLIMANKYHCPEAYYDMYVILTHHVSTTEMDLISNDKDTKNLAFYYLFRASELGFTDAKETIKWTFGKGKSQANSSFYLKQLMKP